MVTINILRHTQVSRQSHTHSHIRAWKLTDAPRYTLRKGYF